MRAGGGGGRTRGKREREKEERFPTLSAFPEMYRKDFWKISEPHTKTLSQLCTVVVHVSKNTCVSTESDPPGFLAVKI